MVLAATIERLARPIRAHVLRRQELPEAERLHRLGPLRAGRHGVQVRGQEDHV